MEKGTPQVRLAAAYAKLAAKGRVTVHKLKAEAGTSTDAAAEFLRDVAARQDTPAVPDLGNAISAIWASAWSEAIAKAREEYADQLDAAIAGQVESSEQAERAYAQAAEYDTDRAKAEKKLLDIQARLDAATRQLSETKAALETAEKKAEQAERDRQEDRDRAIRAEAGLDEMRRALETLRAPVPTKKK